MASHIGQTLQLSIFGESHGQAIGCVLEGLPAGFSIDLDALQEFMDRRAPGHSRISTSRKEADQPFFLSGTTYDEAHHCEVTTGSPICVLIQNQNARSQDYQALTCTPRPGHADLTAYLKYHGYADMSGGGHFSGRLTAPLCVAGGIALQFLEQRDITIVGHIKRIHSVEDERLDWLDLSQTQLCCIADNPLPTISLQASLNMQSTIKQAQHQGDSVGGIIECVAYGVPAGLGTPIFGGIENRVAQAMFGIPAAKGIEFGAGFDAATLYGSQNNDSFTTDDSCNFISSRSNNAGGILGGITTGMPLVTSIAIKPTPSIATEQQTVEIDNSKNTERFTNTTISVHGRHDPCIVPRAVPVCEAVLAFTLLDIMLSEASLN